MRLLLVVPIFVLATALGCNDSPKSQDQVRRETAAATATIVSDTKAAAQGIRDGLHKEIAHHSDAVDINTASRATLETLPGITPALSGRIASHRPYAAPSDLRKKHVLTADEYSAISARITTTN